MCQRSFQQQDIDPARGEGDTGVELLLKHQRNAITEHVTQYATEDAGNDRAYCGNNHGMSGIERNLRADNGKNHQSQRIKHQEHFAQMCHQWRQESGDDRCCRHNHDVFRIFYPAQRVVTQQDVAHRTTADGSH